MKYRFRPFLMIVSLLPLLFLLGACESDTVHKKSDSDPTDTDNTGIIDTDSATDQDIPASCGNDVVNTGELCDGGLKDCTAIDSTLYKGGKAKCADDCGGWNTATCELNPICGNGALEAGETCEQGDMTDCVDIDPQLYSAGKAACSEACTGWDVSTCDINPDADTTGQDLDTPPADPDIVSPDADVDTDSTGCDTTNVGKNCKTDTECGGCLICVNAKCALGCQGNGDCTNYAGTTCNTKLNRCVNTVGSDGACSETYCPSGCCYADKGFQSLKCASTPLLNVCGICKQGEIYLDGKQCVPAACKVGETKCQTYNAVDPNAACFECKTGDLICYENPSCQSGAGLKLLNAKECIPAGETCADGDQCCSGVPCIKGYCF